MSGAAEASSLQGQAYSFAISGNLTYGINNIPFTTSGTYVFEPFDLQLDRGRKTDPFTGDSVKNIAHLGGVGPTDAITPTGAVNGTYFSKLIYYGMENGNYQYRYQSSFDLLLDSNASVLGKPVCRCEFKVGKEDVFSYTIHLGTDFQFTEKHQIDPKSSFPIDVVNQELVTSGSSSPLLDGAETGYVQIDNLTYEMLHPQVSDQPSLKFFDYPSTRFYLNDTFIKQLHDISYSYSDFSPLSTVPLPASAPMFGAALLGLAGLGYAAKRKKEAAVA